MSCRTPVYIGEEEIQRSVSELELELESSFPSKDQVQALALYHELARQPPRAESTGWRPCIAFHVDVFDAVRGSPLM